MVYLLAYVIFLLAVVIAKTYNLFILPQLVLLSPFVFAKRYEDLGYKNFRRGFLYGISSVPLWFIFPPNFSCPASVLNNIGVAVAEETFFRGFLMKRLNNLTVSFLFVLPHLILYQNLASVLTFFPSLLFGWIYRRADSLVAPIIYHFVSNLAFFSVVERFPILYRDLPSLLRI
jgi:membrane protease YdiL (CAAX protease family)